jgi:hypothetical protein
VGDVRLASRTDANHEGVLHAFRRLGCTVVSTHQVGHGFPDLLVSQRRRTDGAGSITYLVEIKDGAKSPSKRKLTEDEAEFHAHWRGRIFTVLSVDDVPGVIRAAATED